MKLTTLALLTATAATAAVATTIATPRLTQANTANAVPMTTVVMADLPTAPEAPFKPVVQQRAVEVPSQYPERKAQLEACKEVEDVASCMVTAVDLDGNGDVTVTEHVAVAGKTRHIYEVQLEPDGPFVENPDLNGNGSWDGEDQIKLNRMIQSANQ
jgi:hypothetical protein